MRRREWLRLQRRQVVRTDIQIFEKVDAHDFLARDITRAQGYVEGSALEAVYVENISSKVSASHSRIDITYDDICLWVNGAGPDVPYKSGKTIAVMQPYLFPYAGYFRLHALADAFVILDCVQFPRRGRVHRCEMPGPAGAPVWLTLPLARQPVGTLIRDLRFAEDARPRLDRRLRRFPWLETAGGGLAGRLRDHLYAPLGSVATMLDEGMRLVVDGLGLDVEISRSSALGLDPALRGADRIIAIVKALGGSHYVNAPGGVDLYEPDDFRRAGVSLSFLEPYRGRFPYLLPALVECGVEALRDDILRHSRTACGTTVT
ncbi:WbqC family protein [Breoghania sp. L-A4]|uniref:WbqC family protein n=1 Tax=Breoghania sp. L-A4 TaxID=2304600 RepID=UPI0013C30106|nr:WbqC family protein [Breoghania sp. L-A4]